MLAPQRVMEIALQKGYKIPRSIRKRYTELLVARAVRFYIEGNLDAAVIDEDLYNGEDFDCICSQADADKNKHCVGCEYSKKDYPNLKYSENKQREWLENFKD